MEIKTPEINSTQYIMAVTQQETINEVYGIVSRRLGEVYKNWFDFNVEKNPRISQTNNK